MKEKTSGLVMLNSIKNECSYFKIENKGESADIYIYDQIGSETDWWTGAEIGISDKKFTEMLAEHKGKSLNVHINSVGGDVYEGIAIYNALKQHNGQVNIYVDGMAASIASVIACAGENVYIAKGASIMIHDVSAGFRVSGTSEEIKKTYENAMANISNAKESIVDIYQSKTGKDREYLLSLMTADNYFRGDDAVALGIATEVIEKPIDNKLKNSLEQMRDRFPKNSQIQAVVNRLFCVEKSPDQIDHKPSNTSEKKEKDMFNTVENKDTTAELRAKLMAELKEAENKRQSGIKAIFNGKHEELMNTCLLDQECTPENAKDKLLEHVLNAVPENNSAVSLGGVNANTIVDESDKKITAVVNAWDNKREGKYDATNEFSGATMHTAIAVIARKYGKDTTGYTGSQFYDFLKNSTNMQVTTDFSVLLSDSLNKQVLHGYNLAEVIWRKIASIGDFKDFRPHEIHSLGVIGELPLKPNENADYAQILLPDSEAQKYRPEERGGIVHLSRRLIIDNDLNNLETQARDVGHAGAFTIENMVFKFLFGNLNLSDGKPLFHADHGNILPAGIPDEAALLAMRDLFDNQTAPNSPEAFLHLYAQLVLADRATLGKVKILNTAETGKEAKETIGWFTDESFIFSQRMLGKGAYFFANPNTAPVIKVGFLDGIQVPVLATEEHFDSGSLKWRMQLDCGVGAVNYRGAIYLPPVAGGAGRSAPKSDK